MSQKRITHSEYRIFKLIFYESFIQPHLFISQSEFTIVLPHRTRYRNFCQKVEDILLQASPSHLLLLRFPGCQISLSLSLSLSLSSFFGCFIISLFLSSDVISSLSISHHSLFLRIRSLSSFFDHVYISVSSWVIRGEERITLVPVCVCFLSSNKR